MKTFFCVISLLVILTITLPIRIFAQSDSTTMSPSDLQSLQTTNKPVEIVDVQDLKADFKQYTQNPGSKKIRFDMILRANITSDRVRVSWAVTGNSIITNRFASTSIISIEEGNTYAIPIEIQPVGLGVTEVYGVAQLTGVQDYVVATVRKNFATNIDGELLPLSPEYNQSKLLYTVFTVVRTTALVVGIIILGYIVYRRFKKWYTQDDRKKYITSQQ